MNSGKMDRRVTIQSYTVTTDDWGHPSKTWSTHSTVWASKRDVALREPTELLQQVGYVKTHWIVRYDSNLDVTMRVVYDNKHYYVIGVREIGREEGMELITELRD